MGHSLAFHMRKKRLRLLRSRRKAPFFVRSRLGRFLHLVTTSSGRLVNQFRRIVGNDVLALVWHAMLVDISLRDLLRCKGVADRCI